MPQVTFCPVETTAREVGGSITYYIDGKLIAGVGAVIPLPSLADYQRGYIIRGGATEWEAYSAETAEAVLVGDGTDIVSTTTPTITGLTLSSLTQGSVPFAGAGGIISQDNANLFWDDGGNLLGVGTNGPTARIHALHSQSAHSYILMQNATNAAGASARMGVLSATCQGALAAFPSGATSFADRIAVIAESDAAGLTLIAYAGGGDISFATGGTTERVNISSAGLVTFNDGWVLSTSDADLDGNDLLIDADGDSYLHASADDVVDLVLAGASGEFGIWINGAEDFTFTANSLNVPSGSNISLADASYIGIPGNELLTVNAAGNFTFSGVGSVVVPDGAWVGADAACSWVFDLTNGDVTTLDDVAIGAAAAANTLYIEDTASPGITIKTTQSGASAFPHVTFHNHDGNVVGQLMTTAGNGAARGTVFLDYSASNAGGTGTLIIRKEPNSNPDTVLVIDENGYVGIGTTSPLAKLHIDQSSNSAAIPVLYLDQADYSEPFYLVRGFSESGGSYNLSDVRGSGSVDGPTDSHWDFIGMHRIAIIDDHNVMTDADYWVPFYEYVG